MSQQKIESKQARVDFINSKVSLVASALLGTVTAPATLDCDWYVRVSLPTGSLGFRYDSYKHRFTIDGVWPVGADNRCVVPSDVLTGDERRAGAGATEISVDADKEAGKIANDVTRRLLPTYFALYIRCVAQITRANAYASNSLENAKKVAAAIGGDNVRYRSDSTTHVIDLPTNLTESTSTYGDFKVEGDSVRVELRALPVASALKLAEFLKTL